MSEPVKVPVRELKVIFSDNQYIFLQTLARQERISMSEIVRVAVENLRRHIPEY